MEEQHCLSAITEDVALEYLIPTTSGAGALTSSLVDYLILTHNTFIDKCYMVKERDQRLNILGVNGEWEGEEISVERSGGSRRVLKCS